MRTFYRIARVAPAVVLVGLAVGIALGDETAEKKKIKEPARTPTALPRIPEPSADAVQLPAGFTAEVLTSGLVYPTSIEFDDRGGMYVAEAGFAYGDEVGQP